MSYYDLQSQIPEDFKLYCKNCNSYITKYSSCECGITAEDIIQEEINIFETDQSIN